MVISQDVFETMVNDFIADHAYEFKEDPLIIKEIEKDALGFVCYAVDSKTSYALRDDGNRNIVLSYIGTI